MGFKRPEVQILLPRPHNDDCLKKVVVIIFLLGIENEETFVNIRILYIRPLRNIDGFFCKHCLSEQLDGDCG